MCLLIQKIKISRDKLKYDEIICNAKALKKTALLNKTCYKIICRDIKTGSTYTPYQCTPVDEGIMSGELPFIAEGNEQIIVSPLKNVTEVLLGRGGIHTYKKLKDAINDSKLLSTDNYNRDKTRNIEIYKCIIPRKTKYFKGIAYDAIIGKTIMQYAAEKIIFKKISFK